MWEKAGALSSSQPLQGRDAGPVQTKPGKLQDGPGQPASPCDRSSVKADTCCYRHPCSPPCGKPSNLAWRRPWGAGDLPLASPAEELDELEPPSGG
ncbi:unnamed protein product [Gadus morhua 'NCC']